MTFDDENWRTKAACRAKGVDPEIFFAEGKGSPTHRRVALARQVCSGCDAKDDCRQWVIAHPQEFGVWAGLTPAERRYSSPPGARYCKTCPNLFVVTVADPFRQKCPTCVLADEAKRPRPAVTGSFFCRRGHRLNEANLYVTPSGKKVCRRCNTAVAAELRASRKAGVS